MQSTVTAAQSDHSCQLFVPYFSKPEMVQTVITIIIIFLLKFIIIIIIIIFRNLFYTPGSKETRGSKLKSYNQIGGVVTCPGRQGQPKSSRQKELH